MVVPMLADKLELQQSYIDTGSTLEDLPGTNDQRKS